MLTNIKTCYKEMSIKVGCLAGFCHHCLRTMSTNMHAYTYCSYPLFKSEAKTGLWTIALYRKDIQYCSIYTWHLHGCVVQDICRVAGKFHASVRSISSSSSLPPPSIPPPFSIYPSLPSLSFPLYSVPPSFTFLSVLSSSLLY